MASMQYDVWAVTPAASADANFYVESVTPTGVVPVTLTLANTTPSINGWGYKVRLTTADDESGVNFTIVGTGVNGLAISETFAGPSSATTKDSTNYFASVSSITVSQGTTAAIEIGYSTAFALPKTRIKGIYYIASGSAGAVTVTKVSNSRVVLDIVTPAVANAVSNVYIAPEGIPTGYGLNDFATVSRTNVTSLTIICG